MGDSFSVNVAEVRSHATTVGTLAGQVREATTAAQTSVSGDAYGLIGQFFASAIIEACGTGQEGFAKAAQTVDQMRDGLNATAELYQGIDQSNATGLNGS